MFTTSGCSLHQGVHYIRVFTTLGCSLHQDVHYIRVFTTSGCSLYWGYYALFHVVYMFTSFLLTSYCCLHLVVKYYSIPCIVFPGTVGPVSCGHLGDHQKCSDFPGLPQYVIHMCVRIWDHSQTSSLYNCPDFQVS